MKTTNGTPATKPESTFIDMTRDVLLYRLREDSPCRSYVYALEAKAAALDALVEAAMVLVQHAQEAYPHFEYTRGQADIAATLAALSAAKAAQAQS